MEQTVLRPMTVGEILDRSFRLYRRHFLAMITIVAIIQIPMMFLNIGMSEILFEASQGEVQTHQRELTYNEEGVPIQRNQARQEGSSFLSFLVPILLLAGLSILANSLATGAMSKGMAEAYLGRRPGVGKVYRFVLPRLLSLIAVGILYGLLVTVGLVLLIIPGIIFALRYALASPIVAIEGKGAFASLGRSWKLAKSNAMRILGLWLVILVLSWAAGAIAKLATFAMNFESFQTTYYVQTLLETGIHILLMPITAGAMALMYFDLRIRKEAFDLEVLASQTYGAGPETQENASEDTM